MTGISTFCLHNEPLGSALEQIAPLADLIEVMDEGLHYLENAEPLLSYTHRFSIHAPCRGTNLASLLEPIRRASVEVMEECFRVAAEVNASVVVHPGYFAWEAERAKAEAQLVRSLDELSHHSRDYGVPFMVENMGNWEYFLLKTPAELPLIGDAGFALDIGHAHQNRCLDAFLARPAQHYHLHDNDGKDDGHLAIGDGTIDFKAVMEVVKKSRINPVIEVATFEGVKKSIERLERF